MPGAAGGDAPSSAIAPLRWSGDDGHTPLQVGRGHLNASNPEALEN